MNWENLGGVRVKGGGWGVVGGGFGRGEMPRKGDWEW